MTNLNISNPSPETAHTLKELCAAIFHEVVCPCGRKFGEIEEEDRQASRDIMVKFARRLHCEGILFIATKE